MRRINSNELKNGLIMEKRKKTLKEWFEDEDYSIRWYRSVFANASLVMLREAGNVSDITMEGVTESLSCFDELITLCENYFLYEEKIGSKIELGNLKEKDLSELNAVERLNMMGKYLSEIISETETICKEMPFLLEDFRKAAEKAESELYILKGRVEALNNRESRI
jgi:hypothetical protein